MRAVVANYSLNDAIGEGRGDIERPRDRRRCRRILDAYRSGVVVQGIAIRQADPPQAVNEAFKEVTAAQQDAQSYINRANAYALQLTQKAQGEAAAFDKVYEQYRLAPEVTRRRMYYETMEQVLPEGPEDDHRSAGSHAHIFRFRKSRSSAAAQPQGRRPVTEFIRSRPLLSGIVAVLALFIVFSAFPIIPETKQAVVVQFGKPNRILGSTRAGINYRIPFFESLVWIDKRVQSVDMDRQQVLSTDQRRLEVDAFARYRIVNPLLMYIRARDEDRLQTALVPILGSEIRNELGKQPFAALLSPERQGVMENVRRSLGPGRRPIWRADHRRPDQEGRPSRRHAARCRVRPHAHGARAGSPVDPRRRRKARADHPRRSRRRSRARFMRQASGKTRTSMSSTGRCSPTRSPSSATGATQPAGGDEHHSVA